MFICIDCGATFEEPQHWTEPHGEYMTGCPECGAGYEEAEFCEACDNWKRKDNTNLCDYCKVDTLDMLIYYLENEFGEAQRKYLAETVETLDLDELRSIKGRLDDEC